jgi:hypothetical protein
LQCNLYSRVSDITAGFVVVLGDTIVLRVAGHIAKSKGPKNQSISVKQTNGIGMLISE